MKQFSLQIMKLESIKLRFDRSAILLKSFLSSVKPKIEIRIRKLQVKRSKVFAVPLSFLSHIFCVQPSRNHPVFQSLHIIPSGTNQAKIENAQIIPLHHNSTTESFQLLLNSLCTLLMYYSVPNALTYQRKVVSLLKLPFRQLVCPFIC